MRVVVQIFKFLCYCVVTIAEFTLMLCLDIVKYLKKTFN